MTPDHLSGGWRRVSIAVGDGPAVEPATVVWLQAGDVFADLRLPRSPTGAPASFAGTTSWRAPHLRWAHHLDLHLPAGDDVGRLDWDGDDLVETGTGVGPDGPAAYTEVWRRLEGSAGPTLALTRWDGMGTLVRTGGHALTVVDDRPYGGAFRACHRRRHRDHWAVAASLGGGAELAPGPPAGEAPLASSHVLGPHRWTVVHASVTPSPTTPPDPEEQREMTRSTP